MTLWMVRGDRHGRYQSLALEKGFAYHASGVKNLSDAKSLKVVSDILWEARPDGKQGQI